MCVWLACLLALLRHCKPLKIEGERFEVATLHQITEESVGGGRKEVGGRGWEEGGGRKGVGGRRWEGGGGRKGAGGRRWEEGGGMGKIVDISAHYQTDRWTVFLSINLELPSVLSFSAMYWQEEGKSTSLSQCAHCSVTLSHSVSLCHTQCHSVTLSV